ncbi:MAG: glutaredoxin domain-containing protein, partial [Thiohalophilus sp.]
MKWLIRYFFRTVRLIMGPFMLLYEVLTTPRGIQRAPEQQEAIDMQTRQLALYQFRTCPFCIKVRRTIKRLSLNIELRDARNDP